MAMAERKVAVEGNNAFTQCDQRCKAIGCAVVLGQKDESSTVEGGGAKQAWLNCEVLMEPHF